VDQVRAAQELNRWHFVASSGLCLGGIAPGCLLGRDALAADTSRPVQTGSEGLPGLPHFAPRAKRVISLFQSGAPSQIDLFDYKPAIRNRRGTELPD